MHVTNPQVDVSPEEAGYRREALERLDRHLREVSAKHEMQGFSFLLARDGKVFARTAHGNLLHDSSDKPFATGSIRKIASITKLFTAVAVFQLVERGKIHLRQSVSAWIPEFKHPQYEGIQIRHLLTHTSGLMADGGYHLEPHPFGVWAYTFAFQPNEEVPTEDPEELEKKRKTAWIKALLAGSLNCKPGEKWSYCSIGYSVLGEVISRASGLSYENYVMEHIVRPLGMKRTFFDVPEELHGEVCLSNDWESEHLRSKEDRRYNPPRAGGGIYSTLDDLFRFGQALLNQGVLDGVRILSRKSVERFVRDELEGAEVTAFNWGERVRTFNYGLGCGLRRSHDMISPGAFGHEGAGRSKLFIDPKERFVVAIFILMDDRFISEAVFNTDNIIWAGLA